MLLKNDFAKNYPAVTEGTVVRCKDGEKLGKISTMNSDSFVVQKGLFFPKDFIFRYDDILTFADGELTVNAYKDDLTEWRAQDYPGWSHVNDINEGRLSAIPRPEYQDQYRGWSNDAAVSDTVRMPVVEEELETQKTIRQAGEVRLHKIVHTELKHFTVPVMKEEVMVDRVPASDTSGGLSADDAFKEKTIAVPIMEEEVTVTKRPVVKEEIRVQKSRTEEQHEVSEEVRKEDVKIDQDVSDKRRKTR